MSVQAIKAGKAYIELTIRQAEFDKKISEAKSRLTSLGKSVTEAGKDISKAFALIQLPIAYSVKTFADFDDQMRLTKAVSGATGMEFVQLSKQARDLGMQTSFTAKQISEGMASLSRMGFTVNEISGGIKPMMDLARATGTSLAESSLIAANAMRAFGLDTSQVEYVCDVLTATANGSAQSLHDLGEALIVSAPGAAQAGENISDLNASLGVMANMGFRGSIAGTALKRAYSQIARIENQRYLAKLGVQTVDANGNLLRMVDILRDITKVMGGLGTAQRINFITKVFEERAAPMALAITKDTKKIDDFLEKMKDVRGEAARQAQGMDAGIGGTLRRTKNSVEGVAISFGESLSPTVQALAAQLVEVTKIATNFIKRNEDFITRLSVWGSKILIIGGALAVTGKSLGMLSVAFSGIRSAGNKLYDLQRFLVYMKSLSKHLTMARAKIILLSKSMKFLNKNMLAIKGGVIIAAVAGTFAVIDSMIRKREEQLAKMTKEAQEEYDKAVSKSNERQTTRDNAIESFKDLRRLAKGSDELALSAKEFSVSSSLIEKLEPFGIREWASIDETTNRIRLATDAVDKFNDAVRKNEMLDLYYQERRLEDLEAATRNQMAKSGGWRDIVSAVIPTINSSATYNKEFNAELETIKKRWQELKRAQHDLKTRDYINTPADVIARRERRLAAQKSLEVPAVDPLAVSQTQADDARTFIADYEKRLQRDKLDPVERKISDVQDDIVEYKTMLTTLIRFLYNDSPIKNYNEIQELMRKRDVDADAIMNELRKGIIEDQTKKSLKEISDYRKALSVKSENKYYDELTDSDPRKALSVLPGVIRKMTNVFKQSFQKYKLAIEGAERPDEDGVVRFTEDEEETLRSLRETMTNNRDFLERLKENFKDAKERVAGMKENVETYGNVYGSFAAKEALSSLFGSPEERTARNTERMMKEQQETNRILRRQNGTVNMAYI